MDQRIGIATLMAILGFGPCLPVQAQNDLIGPLFYTPTERDALDTQGSDESSPTGTAPTQVTPEVLRFNGSVRRSAGRSTGWISGKRLEAIRPGNDLLSIRLAGDQLRVELRENTALLKAGETISIVNPPMREAKKLAPDGSPNNQSSSQTKTP